MQLHCLHDCYVIALTARFSPFFFVAVELLGKREVVWTRESTDYISIYGSLAARNQLVKGPKNKFQG